MKTVNLRVCLVGALLLGAAVVSPPAASAAGMRITTNPAGQTRPAIYGDKIVWEDMRNGNFDIYMYDLATKTETQITNDPGMSWQPDIYGNRIVWQDDRGMGDWDIYMYDLTTKTETLLTDWPYDQESPRIYGNKLVFASFDGAQSDVILADVVAGTASKVVDNPDYQAWPAIYENKVVWEDRRYGGTGYQDIYMHDGAAEKRVSTGDVGNTSNQDVPSIFGNTIAWEDHRLTTYFRDIYIYDTATGAETRLTSGGGQYNPSVWGDNVVWEDWRNASPNNRDLYGWGGIKNNTNADIYMYNTKTKTETLLDNSPAGQFTPRIHGNRVVFEDWRYGNTDIYMVDITPETVPDTAKPTASVSSPNYASDISKTDDFKVTWTGADTGGSGIANYTVQYKIGSGGAWTNWKTDTAAESAIFDGKPGKTYYFRARAKDKAGNVGNWSATDQTVAPLEQGAFSSSGVWSSFINSNLYKGKSKKSAARGAKLTKSFSGAKGVALIVTKRPNGGYAKVFIGTKLIKTINLYASSIKYRVPISIKSSSTSFSGTLKVVVKGAHQSGSKGNRVEIDGLGIRK